MLSNPYSSCLKRLSLIRNEPLEKPVKIDSSLRKAYPHVHTIQIEKTSVEFDDNGKTLAQFADLKAIVLRKNNLTELPRSLVECQELRSLLVSDNPIKSLDSLERIGTMPKLEELWLTDLSATELKLERRIEMPASLRTLSVRGLSASTLQLDVSSCASSLDELTFVGVPWLDLDSFGGNNTLISLENLAKAMEHVFDPDTCRKLFQRFDHNNNGFLDKTEAMHFNAYVFRRFERLDQVPTSVYLLVNLTSLNLSYQAIRVVPDEIEALTNLTRLVLNSCILLESVSAKVAALKLELIDLSNCFSLKTPPPEIVSRGSKTVLTFFKRLLLGSVECKRTKLMLVNYFFF